MRLMFTLRLKVVVWPHWGVAEDDIEAVASDAADGAATVDQSPAVDHLCDAHRCLVPSLHVGSDLRVVELVLAVAVAAVVVGG